jgi:hypothetical protein
LRNQGPEPADGCGHSALNAGEIHRVELLMSLDEPEFLRLLPVALAGRGYRRTPGSVETGEGRERITIRYADAPPLRIASLRLPRLRLTFEFRDGSHAHAAQFLEEFLKHYRRGGG